MVYPLALVGLGVGIRSVCCVDGNNEAVALAAAALRKATMWGGSLMSRNEGAIVETELGA